MGRFKHLTYYKSITICDLPKTYGLVKGRTKTYARNYKRELKNGKGLIMLEAFMKAAYANYPREWKLLYCKESNNA